MVTLTIQNDFKSPVEYIDSAEALNKVFNDPENNRKVSLIRQYRFAGEMDKAQKVKTSLPGLIFIADDFEETEKEVTVYENGEEKKVMQKGKWRLQKSAHLNGLAVLITRCQARCDPMPFEAFSKYHCLASGLVTDRTRRT